jgi:hypothetical protein
MDANNYSSLLGYQKILMHFTISSVVGNMILTDSMTNVDINYFRNKTNNVQVIKTPYV